MKAERAGLLCGLGIGGLFVAPGLLAGVVLQGAVARACKVERIVAAAEASGAAGL